MSRGWYMGAPDVTVIGSGIVGVALAHQLVHAGKAIQILEKGPDYPYPHEQAVIERVHGHVDPGHQTPRDVRRVILSGSYRHSLTQELVQRAGGMATTWRGITLRMRPQDFRPRTTLGHGADWPVDYEALEPWYGRAERFMGVAGTDADNPWAPWRSTPYPLPPVALAPDDHLLATRLSAGDIHLSTTPQAVTTRPFDGRPICTNIGPTCNTCPTGARYSPGHHLVELAASGRCTVRTGTAVRRVLLDGRGAVQALVVRSPEGEDVEEPAGTVVIAAGAIESARLLLLSRSSVYPGGIGNRNGLVGQNLTFHHMYGGRLHYAEALHPGRVAPMTGQSHQFLDPLARERRLGIKVEFTSHLPSLNLNKSLRSGADVLAGMQRAIRRRNLGLHAETAPGPGKYLTLSRRIDSLGDPFAHVHYQADDLDRGTHAWGRGLAERIAHVSGATDLEYRGPDDFHSVYHHMGTARMGSGPHDGVVDSYGRVFGHPGLFVLGGAQFPTASPVNPTLTMVALALRTAPVVAESA